MSAQERHNRDTYLNVDERKVPITVTFYDAEGNPVDLSDPDWTVKFIVWPSEAMAIINELMEIVADQVQYTGQARYITEEADHGHPVGEYRWKAQAEHSDGRIFEVPKQRSGNFGRLFLRATNPSA